MHRSAFGTVYEVEDHQSGEHFAVKQISKAKLSCAEDVEDVRREMQARFQLGCRCKGMDGRDPALTLCKHVALPSHVTTQKQPCMVTQANILQCTS